MLIKLGDIVANPFRNIERYPIDRQKVEALKASIGRTSFWENVVGRPAGDGAQIAYGHHRLVALREMYPPDHEINLITRDLDDAAMLHIMADENMQEWGSSGEVIVETVRAVRDFLRREVPAITSRGRGHNDHENHSGPAIAKFLGWPSGRIDRALSIINAEEQGVITPEDTEGLELRQADELRAAVTHIKKPKVKKEAIKRVRSKIESGEIGYRGVRGVVNEVRNEDYDEARRRPAIPATVAKRLWNDIDSYWRTTVSVNGQNITRSELLRLIAENRNARELSLSVRPWADQLADALDEMATEAHRLADLLRAEQALAIGAR